MFEKFSKILTSKTFFVGLSSIVSGISVIIKTQDLVGGMQLIGTGLAAITLRHGIEKGK